MELPRSGWRGPREPSSKESFDKSGGTNPRDIDDVLVLIDVGALSGGDDEGVEWEWDDELYLRCAWGGEGGLFEPLEGANGTVD